MTAESKTLPREVVEQDRNLRGAEAQAGRGLAELRWRWTRNEDNPQRLSYAEYGRQTGVDGSTVRSDARAWEILMDPSIKISLTDARRLAHMSADRGEAFQALAKIENRALGAMSQDSGWRLVADDIKAEIELERETHLQAGEPAETFDPAAVALKAAERRKAVERVLRRGSIPDDEPTGLEFPAAIGDLHVAAKIIRDAVAVLNKEHRFTDAQLEKLREFQSGLRQAMDALDMAMEGASTDMDALIGSLTEGN